MVDCKHELLGKGVVLLVALCNCCDVELLDHVRLEVQKQVLVIIEVGVLGIPCHDFDQTGHDAVEVDVFGETSLRKLDGEGDILADCDFSQSAILRERNEPNVFHLFLHITEYNKNIGK